MFTEICSINRAKTCAHVSAAPRAVKREKRHATHSSSRCKNSRACSTRSDCKTAFRFDCKLHTSKSCMMASQLLFRAVFHSTMRRPTQVTMPTTSYFRCSFHMMASLDSSQVVRSPEPALVLFLRDWWGLIVHCLLGSSTPGS